MFDAPCLMRHPDPVAGFHAGHGVYFSPPFVSPERKIMNNDVSAKGADEKFCSECGSVIKVKAEICPKCGVRQYPSQTTNQFNLGPTTPSGKNRIAAALFALFLGGS